jgi:formylglycine-generating enzyme required for sulfatase activity
MRRSVGIRALIAVAASFAFALVVLVPTRALAAQPQLVVFRFTGEGIAKAVLDSATTAAETAALRVSAGRFKIVTRDMLAAVVGEEKLTKCEEQARCELDLGVGLGTGYMLAGSLRKVGARVEMAVKLYDVRNLELLAQDTESAGREDELLGHVGALVERLMRGGLALGGQSASRAPSSGAFEDAPTVGFGADADEVVVSFESAPEGAAVRLDDQLLCSTTPCRKRVITGAHQAVFEKERYASSPQKFTAAKGAVVKATLAPRFALVSVETEPPGVGIAIDGTTVGKTPVVREVDEGTAEIAVSDPCWLRSGERVAVKAGERKVVKLAPKARIAGLKVNAEDEKGNAIDVPVSVDGQPAGIAGETLKVQVCARKVTLPLGNETFEAELKLEEGKLVTILAKPGLRSRDGMVRVPGGTYTTERLNFKPWDPGRGLAVSRIDVTVAVKPFLIDATEVTVGMYSACVGARRCTPATTVAWAGITPSERQRERRNCNHDRSDRSHHPVNCVSSYQAQEYCAAAGKRLPTQEEWEWAAKGADPRTMQPWGTGIPVRQLCWDGEGNDQGTRQRKGTCPVGSYTDGDSPQGVKDLVGNVQEWTTSDGVRSCGGSWGTVNPRVVRAALGFARSPGDGDAGTGFRCAKEL